MVTGVGVRVGRDRRTFEVQASQCDRTKEAQVLGEITAQNLRRLAPEEWLLKVL